VQFGVAQVNPSVALLISILVVLFLLRFKLHAGIAVFAGSIVLSLAVLPAAELPRIMLNALKDTSTLRLLGIVICALTMSRLMELKGLLVRLANALETIGPKLAVHVAPVAIGLMPLPGGAVVSAAALKELVRRLGLSAPQATYINFWFRHLCEFATPVYPGVIMAGVFLSVPLSFVLLHLAPIWILMLVFGLMVSWRILRHATPEPNHCSSPSSVVAELIRSAWPVILVFALVIAGIDAVPAFLVTVMALILQQRMSLAEVESGFKYGLEPKILFLLYAVMLFKNVVDTSGAAHSLFDEMQIMGMPHAIILVVLPLLIGFSTGLSSAMVGISIPLLSPFILPGGNVDGAALLLAYGAGGIGYLLSPLHLCLVLSADYYGAALSSVYRYLVPPALAVLAGLALLYPLVS